MFILMFCYTLILYLPLHIFLHYPLGHCAGQNYLHWFALAGPISNHNRWTSNCWFLIRKFVGAFINFLSSKRSFIYTYGFDVYFCKRSWCLVEAHINIIVGLFILWVLQMSYGRNWFLWWIFFDIVLWWG